MRSVEEQLKKLRGHLAHKKQVKPYVIFNDKTFEALMLAKPKTLEELAKVKGFGGEGKRVSGWGQAIIDIFTRPEQTEDFSIELDADGDMVVTTKLQKMDAFDFGV